MADNPARLALRERLDRGPLLADGAMGTQLYARGISYEHCFDELNRERPDLVQAVHRDYLSAGAELIQTNTFGANRYRLAEHGLDGDARDLNRRGARIAREAREVTGQPAFVAGSVGPIGRPLTPVGTVSAGQAEEAFREQVEALLEGGVDALLFETFSDLDELLAAVRAARAVCDLPVIAQMSFAEDGRLLSGEDPAAAVAALEALDVDVIGANCGLGPQETLPIVAQLSGLTRLPVSAQPNAGAPQRLEGRYLYLATPEYFADYARRFVEAGARLVGGCCGTTPRHVAAMAAALRGPLTEQTARVLPASASPTPKEGGQIAASPDLQPPPTGLMSMLSRGDFVISAELDPPRGVNPTKLLAGAALLQEAGVDFVNVADSPMARVRMSCLALATLVQQQLGLEAIIHFTTRDRNLMALQSELMGAHALGVRNVIALTGDPPKLGNYPNATGVWDVDAIGLVEILRRMNEGVDWAGTSIGQATNFCIAVGVNPTAEDWETEHERLRRKLAAGAHLLMCQPLYTLEQLERFLEAVGPLPVPLLLGVLPLHHSKHSEFLHNEVPGITIPESVRRRMAEAGERGAEAGLELAQKLLSSARDLVAGTYLMPSFGNYATIAELVRSQRPQS